MVRKKRPAFVLLETMLVILVIAILSGIISLNLTSLYSAQYAERKVQCDVLDRALEGYAANHLAIKNITKDDEGKEHVTYLKTYPADLEELERLGYINHFKDIDIDEFKYTPYSEKTYGDVNNNTYYELKIKIPNTNKYYTSPGSERSKYISKQD
ncbi:type II secretion system protein [Megamonas hypermegale]|uniref:type II secretion system protein n=1 Tax=Megamonas hypermegale TaxID=158847 RepID=UPI00242B49F6|nr:type II secretion system protein [Megamonas hypermegale]